MRSQKHSLIKAIAFTASTMLCEYFESARKEKTRLFVSLQWVCVQARDSLAALWLFAYVCGGRVRRSRCIAGKAAVHSAHKQLSLLYYAE